MYLESAIPSAEQNRRTVKTSWAGLNRRDDYDSGELTSCKNISVKDIPALEAEQIPKDVITGYAHPISIHGFGDVLIVIYRDGGGDKARLPQRLCRISFDNKGNGGDGG